MIAAAAGEWPAGVTVHTTAERDQAAADWLLSAAPDRTQAREEFETRGATWLPVGPLFAAVAVSAGLVHAALDAAGPRSAADSLAHVLNGGPLFYSPEEQDEEAAYTALLPASTTRTWQVLATDCLAPGRPLLVPAPGQPAQTDALGWVPPMDRPGLLCSPPLLAALVGVGRERAASARESAGGTRLTLARERAPW